MTGTGGAGTAWGPADAGPRAPPPRAAERPGGRQARIVLGKLLEQAAAGAPPDSGVTVAELLARYMEVAELEPSTLETYDGYIRRTILPALGSMPLRKLRGPVLDTFYARLRRCADLTCTGRPFTEHRKFPAISIDPDDGRPAWH